jgi:hypothetical protein
MPQTARLPWPAYRWIRHVNRPPFFTKDSSACDVADLQIYCKVDWCTALRVITHACTLLHMSYTRKTTKRPDWVEISLYLVQLNTDVNPTSIWITWKIEKVEVNLLLLHHWQITLNFIYQLLNICGHEAVANMVLLPWSANHKPTFVQPWMIIQTGVHDSPWTLVNGRHWRKALAERSIHKIQLLKLKTSVRKNWMGECFHSQPQKGWMCSHCEQYFSVSSYYNDKHQFVRPE